MVDLSILGGSGGGGGDGLSIGGGLGTLLGGNGSTPGSPGGGFSLASFLGNNGMDLATLGLVGYGLNKSIGIAEDQLDIQQSQNENAVKAQNFSLAGAMGLRRATTTPGTPEHAAAVAADNAGTFVAQT